MFLGHSSELQPIMNDREVKAMGARSNTTVAEEGVNECSAQGPHKIAEDLLRGWGYITSTKAIKITPPPMTYTMALLPDDARFCQQ